MDGHSESGFYLALGFHLATPVTRRDVSDWEEVLSNLAKRKLILHLK